MVLKLYKLFLTNGICFTTSHVFAHKYCVMKKALLLAKIRHCT